MVIIITISLEFMHNKVKRKSKYLMQGYDISIVARIFGAYLHKKLFYLQYTLIQYRCIVCVMKTV